MRNIFRGEPWPASTIAIISILFTPAVGGIVAGIKEARMGYPERARHSYRYSAISLVLPILWFAIRWDGIWNPVWVAIFDIAIVSPLLASILANLFRLLTSLVAMVAMHVVLTAFVASNYARTYSAWRSSNISDTSSQDASA